MTDTDPILKLLRAVREEGLARDKREEELATEQSKLDEDRAREFKQSEMDRRSFQKLVETSLRELRGELGRQDQQMNGLALRISGNYTGIAERQDMVDQDLRQMMGLLGNVEIATVELSRSTRTLHGRMIEESDLRGVRVKGVEEAVVELDHRVDTLEHSARAIEKRLAAEEQPAIESVEAASGG